MSMYAEFMGIIHKSRHDHAALVRNTDACIYYSIRQMERVSIAKNTRTRAESGTCTYYGTIKWTSREHMCVNTECSQLYISLYQASCRLIRRKNVNGRVDARFTCIVPAGPPHVVLTLSTEFGNGIACDGRWQDVRYVMRSTLHDYTCCFHVRCSYYENGFVTTIGFGECVTSVTKSKMGSKSGNHVEYRSYRHHHKKIHMIVVDAFHRATTGGHLVISRLFLSRVPLSTHGCLVFTLHVAVCCYEIITNIQLGQRDGRSDSHSVGHIFLRATWS